MKKEEAIEKGLELVNRSEIAMLGTIAEQGHPEIRALLKAETESLKKIWFSTNTSSKKVEQLSRNPKACVYFVDSVKFKGLMLVGTCEILQDPESKRRIWHEGDEKYYPLGVTDPDYSVLLFTAEWGKYYQKLTTTTFEL